VLQLAKHYEKSFVKNGVVDETLHYWQVATPPLHYKQLAIIPVFKHLKFKLSWQLPISEITQSTIQALLSEFKKLLLAQAKQFVELAHIEQFIIVKLHKIHLKFVGFEMLVYVLESAVQLLIQSELSFFRYLLGLAELHCWHVDPPPAQSKQSLLFGIT